MFLAQRLDQPQREPRQRESIGIWNTVTGCILQEDLLIYVKKPKMLRSERLLYGYTLSQEPGAKRRITGRCRDFCSADKDVDKLTAIAAFCGNGNGRSELVLCTSTGKVLRYVLSEM